MIAAVLERSPGVTAYISTEAVCLVFIDLVPTRIMKLDKVRH